MNEESNPPSIVSEQTLVSQLGEAYGRLPLEIRSHHAELLERIRRTEDVEIFARPEEGNAWTVTVVSSDCVGILSLIADAVHYVIESFKQHNNAVVRTFLITIDQCLDRIK